MVPYGDYMVLRDLGSVYVRIWGNLLPFARRDTPNSHRVITIRLHLRYIPHDTMQPARQINRPDEITALQLLWPEFRNHARLLRAEGS
jgi:hypothetical protein